jgi:hypothetical protein
MVQTPASIVNSLELFTLPEEESIFPPLIVKGLGWH